jgi:hypothetical protein
MKRSNIDQIYAKLTPTEQAALAFESLGRHDKAETEMIVRTVVTQAYRCPDWAFRRRLMDLINLGRYYGLLYWKTRTFLTVAYSQSQLKKDSSSQAGLFEWLERLLAMEVALIQVCQTLNVNVTTVRQYGHCEHEVRILGAGDPALVQEYADLFMALFEAT